MNRVEFVETLKCGTDLCEHFDKIMSAYDLCTNHDMDIIGYQNSSNSPLFEFETSTQSKAKHLKDIISNSHVINYNKRFEFDVLLDKNKLNIQLREMKLTSG